MQLLFIHADFVEFEVKKKTPVAENIEAEQKKGRLEEALAVFTAVEKVDETNPEVVNQACSEIREVAGQVNTDRVMLYPYAHLSPNLASPDAAVEILRGMEAELKRGDFEVVRAPFGWYKAFTLKCKGHPLSELSRSIVPAVSKALQAEARAISHWFIMTPDGKLTPLQDFDLEGYPGLAKFASYETSKSRAVTQTPPHVDLMQRLEIADYEAGSDPGNMRFYPKGRLIKSLLENYVVTRCTREGAMEVETPLMYDMNHPTLKKYLDRFPARQYSIEADKRHLFLRFAACFGQFLMNRDMTISYRNLPLKMIELTRYSFRKEQRGELVGLRRLRTFTMPDMHTLCKDTSEAIEEFGEQYKLCISVLQDIGLELRDYEVAIRFTRDFYNSHRDFIVELVKTVDRPVLIEMWDERFFYFTLKFEFNFIDALNKASALSTVQIDVENAQRYGIKYIDTTGREKEPIILHCSPSGAIERCIYALLEKAYIKSQQGEVPMLPVWLSPTQIRLIPVSEKHLEYTLKIADQLEGRVDIDDREETVGKKIRDAGREWIPYTAVIGDREIETGKLTITIRSKSQPKKPYQTEMTPQELNRILQEETANMPTRELPLHRLLSKRPKFY